MAEHIRPLYFPIWYINNIIKKKILLLIYLIKNNFHLININHIIYILYYILIIL